jgi:hypothetical protein
MCCMETKTIVIAAVIIAATAALVIAPSLTHTALANNGKKATCKVGGSDVDCGDTGIDPGTSPAARKSCTAGADGAQPNCSGAK